MRRIKKSNCDKIEKMFLEYNYEMYFRKNFNVLCAKFHIRKDTYYYQECYDASQLAYLYSIYQCSIKDIRGKECYVLAYIKKVMKIYFIEALVIADDAKNLCIENNFERLYDDDYRI